MITVKLQIVVEIWWHLWEDFHVKGLKIQVGESGQLKLNSSFSIAELLCHNGKI